MLVHSAGVLLWLQLAFVLDRGPPPWTETLEGPVPLLPLARAREQGLGGCGVDLTRPGRIQGGCLGSWGGGRAGEALLEPGWGVSSRQVL